MPTEFLLDFSVELSLRALEQETLGSCEHSRTHGDGRKDRRDSERARRSKTEDAKEEEEEQEGRGTREDERERTRKRRREEEERKKEKDIWIISFTNNLVPVYDTSLLLSQVA